MALITSGERLAWFQSAKNVTLAAGQITFLDTIQPWVETAVQLIIGYPLEQATYTEFLPTAGGERPPLEFGIDIGWDRIGGVVMPRSRQDPSQGVLLLSRIPVRSVTSVYENIAAWTTGATDGDWPTTSLVPSTGYRLEMKEPGLCASGRLIRTVGSWPTSPRVVKLTYVAGYTAPEIATGFGDVKMAVLMSLGWWFAKSNAASLSAKGNGFIGTQVAIRDFSVTLGLANQIGAVPGTWVHNIIPPEAANLLMGRINMAKYLGG